LQICLEKRQDAKIILQKWVDGLRNWDDMRVFLAVARADGLTGAAPILRMDPATLSRRISRLEADLGAALFVKSPQGYALTDLGVRLREEANVAEAALMRAVDATAAPRAGLTGQIRLGAPDGCANYLLPQICAKIVQQNPDLEIQILSLPRVVNLSRREADMAITVSRPVASRLTVTKITDYQLHLVAHQDRPAPVTMADVKASPMVGYIQDMIFDKELDYLGNLAEQGVAVASNSVAVQLQALRQNAGLGIVHDFALPFAPELRRIMTDAISLTRAFYLVRHASDRQSDRLNRFASALVTEMKQEVLRLEAAARLTEGGSFGDAEKESPA
jgi:DNA-binding transcriptional LysR family regulator